MGHSEDLRCPILVYLVLENTENYVFAEQLLEYVFESLQNIAKQPDFTDPPPKKGEAQVLMILLKQTDIKLNND